MQYHEVTGGIQLGKTEQAALNLPEIAPFSGVYREIDMLTRYYARTQSRITAHEDAYAHGEPLSMTAEEYDTLSMEAGEMRRFLEYYYSDLGKAEQVCLAGLERQFLPE